MNHIQSRVAELIDTLREERDALKDDAKDICDNYWAWFTQMNKEIAVNRNRGNAERNTGTVAPRVRHDGGDIKIYIEWSVYRTLPWAKKNIGTKESTARWGKRIKPYQRGYTRALFERHCEPWELEQAVEAEEMLNKIRIALDVVHETIVKLKAVERRFENEATSN